MRGFVYGGFVVSGEENQGKEEKFANVRPLNNSTYFCVFFLCFLEALYMPML